MEVPNDQFGFALEGLGFALQDSTVTEQCSCQCAGGAVLWCRVALMQNRDQLCATLFDIRTPFGTPHQEL